jgi:F0F1-type ATP synthase assembly protein I
MASKRPIQDYIRYSGLAFQLIALLLVGMWLGGLADEALALETPWFTLLGVLLGLGAGLYQLLRDLLQAKDE